MPALLRQLSTNLLAACVTIDNDGLALARAVDRIIADRHPIKQPHSKGAKDAVILEHAVETTAQLRDAGFAEICIFVSSNTGDFANPGSTNLHAQLAASFNPVSLRYAQPGRRRRRSDGGWLGAVNVDEQAQIQLPALSLKELIQPSAMTALD